MTTLNFSNLLTLFYRILTLASFVGLLSPNLCNGQRVKPTNAAPPTTEATVLPDTLYLDFSQDIATQLLPFEDLLKLAVAYSPIIKFGNELAVSQQATYRLSKINILRNAEGFINYSSGNQAIVSSLYLGGDPLGQITNGYRGGASLSVSLYDLFGRKQQIRQAYANYRSAELQKSVSELQVKREMIEIYQNMLTSQRILKVRLQDEQASFTAFQVAEAEAQQGRKDPEAWANSSQRYAQTKTIAEQARGDFLKNVYFLEAMVGVPIQQLKRK